MPLTVEEYTWLKITVALELRLSFFSAGMTIPEDKDYHLDRVGISSQEFFPVFTSLVREQNRMAVG
jgi:hypothetical protein